MSSDFMKIFIAGLTGTGKSSLAEKIAKEFNIEYIPSSLKFREFMKLNIDENGWWTHKGLDFIKQRLESDFDERFDKFLLDFIDEKEDFVIDSWTMPWLYKFQGLRIYLTAPFDTRVERVSERDELSYDEAKQAVKLKDQTTKLIYIKKYGFDIIKDRKIFDFIINTEYINKEKTFEIVKKYVSAYKQRFK